VAYVLATMYNSN